jgi:hypothetical protein
MPELEVLLRLKLPRRSKYETRTGSRQLCQGLRRLGASERRVTFRSGVRNEGRWVSQLQKGKAM